MLKAAAQDIKAACPTDIALTAPSRAFNDFNS
jgi:hypothetical protein